MMFKRITKALLSLNLFAKLMIMLLLISIVPIFLIQLASYKLTTSIIEEQTKELIKANLQQSSSSVEEFFKAYDNIILDVYTDSSYIDNLKYVNVWDTKNYYGAKHIIVEKLENIVYVYSEILGIAAVGKNGDACFYDKITLSGEESFCFDVGNLRIDPLFKESLEVREAVYSGICSKTDAVYGKKHFFYIAHQLIDFNNYMDGAVGSIILCIDESALREVYSAGMDFESNYTFLVNEEGVIVSFPYEQYIGLNLYGRFGIDDISEATKEFFKQNEFMDSDRLEVHVSSIKDGKFSLISVQNLTYALRDVESSTRIIIFIGIFIGGICILAAMSFAASTDKSAKKIVSAMGKADKGDYDVQILLEGRDEFAMIAHHFNDMIAKIKLSTMQEKDALVRKKNAEIRSLEAQINPHFLYNTLDAINWVAIEHDEMDISKMLISLANILRYSIQKSNEIVTVEEELEYMKKYIYLQQERFCYSFQYIFHVDEELRACKIHKLLIQPLIENTIIHGFPGKSGHDMIDINIERKDKDYLQILVKDNGKGMPGEMVERFNSYDYRSDTIETSIGVRNVITRLELYYGSDSYFHVDSCEQGTTVTILIPYEV